MIANISVITIFCLLFLQVIFRNELCPSGSAPSAAPSLDYCRLPSHLGKSSELVCTRFGVSYLDILDLCHTNSKAN